ncbi:hypothetical protein SAY87_017128 [Trapa incisa]|uniref:Uncharacterized protein n=1 Tax=Trapa incisa TaxID=236973 RepID=A0AAN7QVX1_9MYRT|nr:hypothetical protein SAY87_017128 [Trapa incisa]
MRKVLTSDILSPARYGWLHDKRVDEADNLIRVHLQPDPKDRKSECKDCKQALCDSKQSFSKEDHQVVLTEPELRLLSFSTGRRGCGHNSGDCYDNYSSGKNDTSFFMEKATGDVQGQLLESFDEMGPSEPVVACGEPRLPLHLYP